MKARLYNILLVLFLLATAAAAGGCGSAGPPAPPTEVPSPVVLKFSLPEPADIKNEFPLNTIQDVSFSIAKYVNPAGDLADEITYGRKLNDRFFDEFLAPGMNGISAIEIPVGVDVTTFEDTIDFGQVPGFTSAVLRGVHGVKIDFADFAGQGCSGHTAAVPICMRIWIEDKGVFSRYIMWRFDEYPLEDDAETVDIDEKTPGAGSFRVQYIDYVYPEGVGNLFRIDYDVKDDKAKSAEMWGRVLYADNTGLGIRYQLDRSGGTDAALTRISANLAHDSDGMSNPDLWDLEFRYLAQFRDTFDLWSGSIADGYPFSLQDLDNVCARLSTGDCANPGDCTDNSACSDVGGIDIRVGIDFLPPLDAADIEIPPDFPELPTF